MQRKKDDKNLKCIRGRFIYMLSELGHIENTENYFFAEMRSRHEKRDNIKSTKSIEILNLEKKMDNLKNNNKIG